MKGLVCMGKCVSVLQFGSPVSSLSVLTVCVFVCVCVCEVCLVRVCVCKGGSIMCVWRGVPL